MESRERLACRSVEGYARTDWEDVLRELFAPHAVYTETGTDRRAEGVDAVLDVYRVWRTGFPDIRGEVSRVLAADDSTAVELVWRGTHTGPLATRAGAVPPTGVVVETAATLWQRWDGDRIVHQAHHVDVLTLLSRIGVLPVPTATGRSQ